METKLYQLSDLTYILRLLEQDEIIAFPTETVFGLGGNAFSDRACCNIYQAKGRPSDNPFIIHIAHIDQLNLVAQNIPDLAYQLFSRFTPGPLTIILPKSETVSPVATAQLSSVAVRIPAHPSARALLRACPFPLAAPSANRSGRPSPTNSSMVMKELQGRIAGVLDGTPAQYGLESTVISCLHDEVLLLRPGAVSLEELETFLHDLGHTIRIAQHVIDAVSPGMRHAHYQPAYPIKLFTQEHLSFLQSVQLQEKTGLLILKKTYHQIPFQLAASWQVRIFTDEKDFARQLYQTLVEFERQGIKLVYAELPCCQGLGLALCDRLQHAAANQGISKDG